MESLILTLLIFLPVIGAILMLLFAALFGKEKSYYFIWIALITTGLQLIFSLI